MCTIWIYMDALIYTVVLSQGLTGPQSLANRPPTLAKMSTWSLLLKCWLKLAYMVSHSSLNNSPKYEDVCQLNIPNALTAYHWRVEIFNPGLINHQLAILKFHHDAAHCIAQNPVQCTKLFFQTVWTGKPRYAGWLMVHDVQQLRICEHSNAAYLWG